MLCPWQLVQTGRLALPQLYAFATEYPGSYMDSKDDGIKVHSWSLFR